MKKIPKGQYGYINNEKRKRLVIMLIMFAIPLAIFVSGIRYTGSRNNVLTIIAVLGMIPAAKFAVDWIMILTVKSAPESVFRLTEEKASARERAYELVVTAYEGRMPLDAVVAYQNSVACLSLNGQKELISKMETHMAKILSSNGLWDETVKIFTDEARFARRLDQMSSGKEDGDSQAGDPKREAKVMQVIRAISL